MNTNFTQKTYMNKPIAEKIFLLKEKLEKIIYVVNSDYKIFLELNVLYQNYILQKFIKNKNDAISEFDETKFLIA